MCVLLYSYMYESCHTFEWVMSHTRMCHVTHMNESHHTREWVMSHLWTSHVTHTHASCHTHEWVLSHVWICRVTHVKQSCHTQKWVISAYENTDTVFPYTRICMRHVCVICMHHVYMCVYFFLANSFSPFFSTYMYVRNFFRNFIFTCMYATFFCIHVYLCVFLIGDAHDSYIYLRDMTHTYILVPQKWAMSHTWMRHVIH